MHNRIAQKLLVYFIIPLCIFAVMSGVLFQALFSRAILEEKQSELLARATTLAETLSEAAGSEGVPTSPNGMGRGQSQSSAIDAGLGAYLPALSLLDVDVWVLDANLNFLTTGRRNMTLVYQDLPPDADEVVSSVFTGKTVIGRGFSDLLGTPTLTVGVPIYRGSAVYGALLMHDAVSGMQTAITQGVRVLLYAGAIALGIAVVLAIWLSYAFAKPLHTMKNTALTLAQGDYTVQTGVKRSDEIGKLAQAMDVLSVRLREARQQKEQQERLRMEFLANVSHELRTPATVLRGSLEALCDGVVTDPAQVKQYHEQMLRETIGLQRLTNDLLELSKLQNPDFPIEHAAVCLQDVLGDALYAADQVARKKQISITREMTGEPINLQGDYGRLRQMLMIVLDNAVKFSSEGGTIEVTLAQKKITIQDYGIGIAPDLLPFIFDRFRKTPSEENRQGSGLGLAIARQIAVRHGMEIAVKSTVGEGTRFTFSLPSGL